MQSNTGNADQPQETYSAHEKPKHARSKLDWTNAVQSDGDFHAVENELNREGRKAEKFEDKPRPKQQSSVKHPKSPEQQITEDCFTSLETAAEEGQKAFDAQIKEIHLTTRSKHLPLMHNGKPILFHCVETKNLHMLNALVKCKKLTADDFTQEYKGKTFLFRVLEAEIDEEFKVACTKEMLRVLKKEDEIKGQMQKLMIKNEGKNRDFTVVHLAALIGSSLVLSELEKAFFTIPEQKKHSFYDIKNSEGDTPIFWAIRGKHKKVCEWLIEKGADVNVMNTRGCTPLHWAVRFIDLGIVKLLTENRAKVWLSSKERDPKTEQSKPEEMIYRESGFGTPLILATALGRIDILEHLMKTFKKYKRTEDLKWSIKDFVNFPISNGFAAIHYASYFGHISVMKMLYENGANLRSENDFGHNPLLLAIESRQIESVKFLLCHDVDMYDADNSGRNAWDYCINSNAYHSYPEKVTDGETGDTSENNSGDNSDTHIKADSEGEKIFHLLVQHTNEKFKALSQKPVEQEGQNQLKEHWAKFRARSPLHVMAEYGDKKSLEYLLDHLKVYDGHMKTQHIDPWDILDESENSLLFYAVSRDKVDILKFYFDQTEKDYISATDAFHNAVTNKRTKDTIFHEAVRLAKTRCLEYLLKSDQKSARIKSLYNQQNILEETPLHVACISKQTTPHIVTYFTKTENMTIKIQNARDDNGNTALHVVMKLGRTDFVEHLFNLNQSKNKQGDTPLHVAARYGQTAAMHALFKYHGTQINIRETNKEALTALHLAALYGEEEQLELLIDKGADICAKNMQGNTALHSLVKRTMTDPNNKLLYIDKFMCIINKCVTWWCKRKEKLEPLPDSDMHKSKKREIAVELITETYNYDGLSVLSLAASHGAKDLFEEIVQMTDVFHFTRNLNNEFDITYFTPTTTIMNKEALGRKRANSVAPETDIVSVRSISCIEHILTIKDIQLASEMLEIVPMQQLVKRYWGLYQYIYMFLAIFHIVYMSLLGVYALPVTEDFVLKREDDGETSKVFPYIFLLLWPGMLFVYEVVHYIRRIGKFLKRQPVKSSVKSKSRFVYVMALFESILKNTTHFASLVFSVLVFVWFALYVAENKAQLYILAVSLIIGWMYTISLTTGFEGFFSFSIILKNIMIKDILKFIILYIILMVGFSLAFRVLLYPVPTIAQNYPTLWHTFFYMFNLMLGLEDHFFDDSYDETYSESGYTGLLTRIVYLLFIMFSAIVLLNVLIAMMTDSYAEVKHKEGKSWKVETLKAAMYLETMFPPLTKWLHRFREHDIFIKEDKEHGRWMLTVANDSIQISNSIEARGGTTGVVARLDHRVSQMDYEMSQLTTNMAAVMSMLNTLVQLNAGIDQSHKKEYADQVKATNSTPRPKTAFKKEVQIARKKRMLELDEAGT